MAFLDNSGDIILDAVLTDAGRKRLAEGNGSFRITKYAFGDDEIDYSNYNANHASGSAYYDLEILQTPVLEAFTNNAASMKSKLITLTNNNILYLPVIHLNKKDPSCQVNDSVGSGSHLVVVDSTTEQTWIDNGGNTGGTLGYFVNGVHPSANTSRNIRVDQGLDTSEIPNTFKIDAELQENQYIVEIDNRFGTIVTGAPDGGAGGGVLQQSWSYLDDDNIASYFLSTADYVNSTPAAPIGTETQDPPINTAIAGPRGTHLTFRIQASTNLRTSTYLFDRLGSSFVYTVPSTETATTFLYIDTIVRVTGATTRYKLDIPVRFVKQSS